MKRILIVDDEQHILRVMRLALERAGYEVKEAAHGLEALEVIRQTDIDALITDIDMPRMNGRELCEQIQITMPEYKFLVCVVTARAETEHRDWTGKMENLVFMEKPVSIRKLVSMLNAYFSGSDTNGEQLCKTAP